MPAIMKAADLPLYWKRPVFSRCAKVAGGTEFITFNDFKKVWERISRLAHDEAARFVYYLAGEERDWLVYEDFMDMIQDIIDTHPGLTFLRDVSEFHNRYIQTVANSFFFCYFYAFWQRLKYFGQAGGRKSFMFLAPHVYCKGGGIFLEIFQFSCASKIGVGSICLPASHEIHRF